VHRCDNASQKSVDERIATQRVSLKGRKAGIQKGKCEIVVGEATNNGGQMEKGCWRGHQQRRKWKWSLVRTPTTALMVVGEDTHIGWQM
jgi:hypothetical protein